MAIANRMSKLFLAAISSVSCERCYPRPDRSAANVCCPRRPSAGATGMVRAAPQSRAGGLRCAGHGCAPGATRCGRAVRLEPCTFTPWLDGPRHWSVYAERSGVWLPVVGPYDHVTRGQTLGTLVNYFGETLETFTSQPMPWS